VVNTMLDEIERLLHEVKGVCDNIAHDMRTPLTRLLAGLERSRRRASSVADYQGHVDEAIEEVHGMLRTFSALLRISEVEDGVRRAGFIDIDLAAIAQDAVELFEPAAEERGILLEYNGSQQHSTALSGDPDLIFEAVSNLIDNALKFSGDHGRVVVTVAGGPDELFIDVEDTGPGIEPAEIDAVLRRFHRTEPSRTTPGNGLGLSLVAAIARIHDLDLTLSNTGTGLSARMTRRLKY
jgi:signal transduction histidine kinase